MTAPTFHTLTAADWQRSMEMARSERNEVREKLGAETARLCRWCHGSGRIPIEPGNSKGYRCTDCEGTGRVRTEEQT